MQLEVGSILEGKITGITKFGAFVELPGGKTGMVHISEVASTYVKEIRDFVTENQVVKVKVLTIGEDGKVSLSIKRALPPPPAPTAPAPRHTGGGPMRSGPSRSGPRAERDYSNSRRPEPATFEDMMARFKQTSDEKMSDLKRNTEAKRGSFTRRPSNNGGK